MFDVWPFLRTIVNRCRSRWLMFSFGTDKTGTCDFLPRGQPSGHEVEERARNVPNLTPPSDTHKPKPLSVQCAEKLPATVPVTHHLDCPQLRSSCPLGGASLFFQQSQYGAMEKKLHQSERTYTERMRCPWGDLCPWHGHQKECCKIEFGRKEVLGVRFLWPTPGDTSCDEMRRNAFSRTLAGSASQHSLPG